MATSNRLRRLVTGLVPSKRVMFAAVAALGLASATQQSHAQFGMMGMGGEMGDLLKPATNSRLLRQYSEMLGLSPDQKRAADELLLAYQTEFRDSVHRLEEIGQSIQEEIQDTGDWELYQTVLPGLMVKFVKKAETLNSTFMNDLKTLLDNSQLERFPAVERVHRRESSIKAGLEGMQRVDLADLVKGLRLEGGAASGADAVLEQYAMEMDREIVAHDKMLRSFLDKMSQMIEDGKQPEEDPEFYQKWMKDMAESGQKMEAVNTRFASQVRAALPEAAQPAFDTQIKLAKYPAIYKKSYAERTFEAAAKLSDLDAGQKEALGTLRDTYRRESAAANDKWAAVLDDLKSKQGDGGMFGGGMWMIRQDEGYTQARDVRKAVDDKSVESLMALLTEAQRAKLPKKNYRPEWDFDRPSAND